MRLARGLGLALCLLTLNIMIPSCVNSKKIAYFDEIPDAVVKSSMAGLEADIQPGDLLAISVSSLNASASQIFNSPNSAVPSLTSGSNSAAAGMNAGMGGTTLTSSQSPSGYLVDNSGNIKYPVLGDVKAQGLTKRQLEDTISAQLIDKKLLLDPIVSVRFTNFRVTVLGEVGRPTTINVTNERISILEALGLAGDLTIYGKRDNVLLIREDGNRKIIHRIDLTSRDILTSPFYYLKTNDVIYVEPGKSKIASTSRALQLVPIVLSALSFIAVIAIYSFRNN